MGTLEDRPNTALLIVDAQEGVVAGTEDREGVLARIDRLVEKARAADVAVIWVQDEAEDRHPGSEPWRIVGELSPADGDTRIGKQFGDSFEDTDLHEKLGEKGVGSLVVCGAQTDACIRCTLHGALARGYDVTLVADAHTTEDLRQWGAPMSPRQAIDYANMYWSFTAAPGRTTAVLPTDQVTFA